jgi:hypothetical protein
MLTQLRFIYNGVISGIQWMVCWWVLVHFGTRDQLGVPVQEAPYECGLQNVVHDCDSYLFPTNRVDMPMTGH